LFFLDLNIIFNLSHPSNHTQTSTNFTLNQITFTFNPLKVIKKSFTFLSTLREREGKEVEIPLFFNQHRLCNGLRVISRLQLCPQFIFQLNYENDEKSNY